MVDISKSLDLPIDLVQLILHVCLLGHIIPDPILKFPKASGIGFIVVGIDVLYLLIYGSYIHVVLGEFAFTSVDALENILLLPSLYIKVPELFR